MKAFMYWSGGKDSALALYTAKQQGIDVQLLVTTVSSATNRVAMHGVPLALVQQQASAMGLPLRVLSLPEMPPASVYEDAVNHLHRQLKSEGYTHTVFGDIFLEDLKTYRERLLARQGLLCLFPLWAENSTALLHRFMKEGFKAIVVCVNAALLAPAFCGRLLDDAFLADLPAGVDACGEAGEYHSFVFDGPLFPDSIPVTPGNRVYKEYPAPKADGVAKPLPPAGFWFMELLPA